MASPRPPFAGRSPPGVCPRGVLTLTLFAVVAVALLVMPGARAGPEILREAYAPSSWDTSFANVYVGQEVAQSFVAHSSFLLTRVELYVFDQPGTSSPDILQVFLAADTGGHPGAVLSSTARQGSQNWSWVAFSFYPWVSLSANQRYWIVASDAEPRPKGYEWAMNLPGDYAYGEAQWMLTTSATWTNGTGADLFFRVYGLSGPSISLQVAPAAFPVDPGAVVAVRIWFNNSGNEVAGRVDLTVALAPELLYVSDDASSVGGVASTGLSWTFTGVTVGTHAMTLWARVDSAAPYYDGQSLTAVVNLNYTDTAGTLQVPVRAVGSVTVLIPVIRMQAEAAPAHVAPGQTFNVTVSFMNLGSGAAAVLWLNASAGPRLTVVGDDALSAGGTPLGPSSWRFTNVTGQSYSFNVTARADALAWPGDRLDLRFNASYTDGLSHPLGRVRATASASIHGPSLVSGVTLDRAQARPGDALQVLVYANNTGDEAASRIWVNVTLSPWVTLIDSVPAAPASGSGVLPFVFDSVTPGPLSIVVRLRVTANAPPGDPLPAHAQLEVMNLSGAFLRPSNATATAVVVTPRLAIDLIAASTPALQPGDRVDLQLRVNNSGNERAARVWVNFTLPRDTLLVNSSLPWAVTNGSAYGWMFDDMGPSERTIDVRIEASARLTAGPDLVARMETSFIRLDGASIAGPTARVTFPAAPGGFLSGVGSLVLWAAVLGGLFGFFLLLAYLDLLPRRRTCIDDVFLLHNSGILICHYSTTLHPDVDSDIASGMLMAVRNFVADALRTKNGALQELRYGDYRIHMAHGVYSILVVFTRGGSPKRLDAHMTAVLKDVETLYAKTLESWSGRTEDFKGVEEVLLRLVET